MNDIDKLRVLLPHWIEHNMEHGSEFASWADRVSVSGNRASEEISAQLARAVSACEEMNRALSAAMNAAGGPLEHEYGHVQSHTHDHSH